MEIRTLANTSITDITNAFNEAFSDYFIKLEFTEQGMATKLQSEHILPRYSVGAFEENKLVGFILHGYDEINHVKTIYNAGTGVIPSFRRKGITTSLYKYISPVLASQGIHHHVLEVIENNDKAYGLYKKLGFSTVRNFSAFKGYCDFEIATGVVIKPISIQQWKTAETFMNFEPAWQNSSASIERGIQDHALVGAFINETLAGYAAYVPATGRVRQFAVAAQHRRRGAGKSLFAYMCKNSQPHHLTTINIDEADHATIQFFKALGFERLIGLWEMKMVVE
jgi:ribosomal protein S18 acetylase RimI-like enzyme